MMPAGSLSIRPLSEDDLPRRLRDINLSTHYPELAWSTETRALRVNLSPFGAGDSLVEHYAYEDVDAWWPDTYTATAKQPTAFLVIDGDAPGDRKLLVGTRDGFVLQEDRDAEDDDGQAIDSFVRMGPLLGPEAEFEGRFSHWQVTLADNQGSCRFQVYASNEADVLGSVKLDYLAEPGLGPMKPNRIAARHVWAQLRNASPGRRWAFESLKVRVARGGRLKPKARAV